MTVTIPLELNLSKQTYLALQQAASQWQKTEVEIALDAIKAYLANLTQIDPLLGLFVDEPEMIAQLEADIMKTRETAVIRLTESNE